MYVYMHGEVGSQYGVSSVIALHLIFGDKVPQSPSIQLEKPSIKPKEFSRLPSDASGFYLGAENPISGPQTCIASTFLTDQSSLAFCVPISQLKILGGVKVR